MHPLYVAFDLALAAIAARSIVVLGWGARWTSIGWAAVAGYGLTAATAFAGGGWRPAFALVAYTFIGIAALAFSIGAARHEPRAEPWYWPRR